ncbi:chaperone protein dnaJ 72 isoform X1 [Amborella trichopoda]|uniref:chaperone protein dnaJ 72 isoform X1 n=1 Tax=Amborella trichopoda TaxID=13333 RepID=UPI0009C0A746|nr:chaperone protein dnaJ 72 isoform X1 [Amborella trichopoda]|eukprot:XP_020518459.1 chaperone protein dnaJ 72 isoform X1 [Amborella trichopoda]
MHMDHYKVLELRSDATKEEIKEAFRKLALKFHPDRHTHSSKEIKESSIHRFKQISEAYDILGDDKKRANYDRGRGPFNRGVNYSGSYGFYKSSYRPRTRPKSSNYSGFDSGILFQFLTQRRFLLNVAFASILFGGAVFIKTSGDAIWKMRNSGQLYGGVVTLKSPCQYSENGGKYSRPRNHLKKQWSL